MNHDDNDKKRGDAFNPGVTREQIEKAEQLLSGLDLPMFVERRNLGQELRPGILHERGGPTRVEVKVSIDPIDDDGSHLILSRDPLPAMRGAEVSIESGGRVKVLSGVLDASQPGRRRDDRINDDVMKIAFFHPVSR